MEVGDESKVSALRCCSSIAAACVFYLRYQLSQFSLHDLANQCLNIAQTSSKLHLSSKCFVFQKYIYIYLMHLTETLLIG